jgi:Na+/melibiose symporter-like transporter
MTIRSPKQTRCRTWRSTLTQAGFALLLLALSPPVFAYLDPSTGSMVVSAIVGIFASIALAVKTYWYKIKGFFKRDSKQDPDSRNPSE